MSVLELSNLDGNAFILAEVLEVFEQVNTILAGASSSFSFTVTGDTGSQTITTGNTLHIDGGNGIATVAEATDTVRIVVDLSQEPNNSLSFDSSGKLFGRDLLGESGGGSGTTYEPKYIITDVSHGFGSAGQVKLLQGDFSLAQANSLNSSADYVALIIDSNNYYLLGSGFHQVTGHGLEIGKWYALSTSVAGGYELSYLLGLDEIKQNAFIAVDSNTIYVDLEEAEPGRVVPEVSKIAQEDHEFSVGDIVSLVSGVWVAGVAGKVCFFVKEVTDADNFIISPVWGGTKTVTQGKLYAINPSTPGAIVDVDTLDASVDPITRVGFATKTNYLAGFCESPLICCGASEGGGGGGGSDVDYGTLIFSESFEGGEHEGTYSDSYNLGTLDFVNNPDSATDGDYYAGYLTASTNNDVLTYYARGTLPDEYFDVVQEIDIAFEHIAAFNCNPIILLREETAGSQTGFRVNISSLETSDGFGLVYNNNLAGETLSASDIPDPNPEPVVDTWYRLTLKVKLNTGENTNDGEVKWKVERLQGSVSGGTDRTIVSTFIPERTVSLNTHLDNVPTGLNGHYVAGGNITTGQSRSADWGLWYDRYKLWDAS